MKKLGAFLLTLASCFALASCGSKKTAAPTTVAPTTTVAPDPGTQTYTYTSDSAEKVIEKLDGKVSLSVNLPYKQGNTYSLVSVELATYEGDVVLKDPTGVKYLINEGSADHPMYYELTYNQDIDGYTKVQYNNQQTAENFVDLAEELEIACGLNITYTSKDENHSFAGRPSVQYLNSYTQDGSNITEEYVIDKATGLCIKHSILKGSTPVYNETTFEVTEMKTGDDVKVYFDGEDSRILVSAWDDKFMDDCGFNDTGSYKYDFFEMANNYAPSPGVELPAFLFKDAEAQFNNNIQCGFETEFLFTDTNKNNSGFAAYVIRNLYECGAKYDATGTERSLDDFIDVEVNTLDTDVYDLIIFDAYTSSAAQNSFLVVFDNTKENEAILSVELVNEVTCPSGDLRTKTYKSAELADVLTNLQGSYILDVVMPTSTDGITFESYEATLATFDDHLILIDPEGKVYLMPIGFNDYCFAHFYDEDEDDYHHMELDSLNEYINPSEALSIGCNLTINYKKVENCTEYPGRACTKFINNYIKNGANIEEVYIIDIATGLCLEHSIKANNTPIINETTFKVTSITVGYTDVKPYFDAEYAKIKTEPWDDSFMAACGFSDVMSGEDVVWGYSMLNIMNTYKDTGETVPNVLPCDSSTAYNANGVAYFHQTTIELLGQDIAEYGKFAKWLVRSIVYCGIKYDSAGQPADESVIMYTEVDDDEIGIVIVGASASGYVDVQKKISVSVVYTYTSTNVAKIIITITDANKAPVQA